ncbi:hypothetical protein L6452_38161 [Arctium lappa]|uniref:Uncharacterized protein n=1 Tax=Arctium lappa TaxID=4217 RepID=A0ACB8Y500_ARCLA|nr:hypothetical protein L6452_38161 [Arctium lappa]
MQEMAIDQSMHDVSNQFRPWIDLPCDILSAIVDRLPLIDLLSFRGTCKDFRSVSAGVSAQIQSSLSPWILLFNENDRSECIFYNDLESKTYKRNIPDLEGVNCLASYQGWLLLFKDGSVFFFCPFSLAKISLPDFPHDRFDDHVASFSDVPTSPDCIVSVINRADEATVEVHVISKGETSWTRHVVANNKGPIIGATFVGKKRTFHYLDNANSLLTFSVNENKWKPYRMVESKDIDVTLPYYIVEDVLLKNVDYFRRVLGVEDDEDLVVFGFTYQNYWGGLVAVFLNEFNMIPDSKRMRRAVWIQPRFFEADRNHHW